MHSEKNSDSSFHDPEKGPVVYDEIPVGAAAIPGEVLIQGDGLYHKLQRFAAKMRVETRGIERVPPNERHDSSMWNIASLWVAANLVVSSFALGTLGISIFQLGFGDSVLVIVFFNLLSTIPVAAFSVLGCRFGIRQLALSRFYFGWYGVRIIAFINALSCIGWSSVNVIVGAQLLTTVNHNIPSYGGIIMIALLTLVVVFFGYKIVHTYEKWSWIPSLFVFIVIIARLKISGAFENLPFGGSGPIEAAAVLSFGSAIYGFGTGWTSFSADYTVYQPETQSGPKVFIWTYCGLNIPLIFVEVLGAACMTATKSNARYAAAYKANKVGGLIGEVIGLGRFGEFCLVLLALSIIANNCPNIYSISLSIQVIARPLQRVPRFVWTILATAVYIAIAIPGSHHFETVLEYFMLLIAYWLAIYEAIALAEHFIFLKGTKGYKPEIYDQPHLLPPGFAAIAAFVIGIIGVFLGMSQVWWVGFIARKIGLPQYGGDIGFILGFGFAFPSYCLLRYFEKKKYGR